MDDFFTVSTYYPYVLYTVVIVIQRIRRVESEMEASVTSHPEIQCQINILKLNGKLFI